jgi:hypothetical protein
LVPIQILSNPSALSAAEHPGTGLSMQANCHMARHGYRVATRPELSHASRNLGFIRFCARVQNSPTRSGGGPDHTKYCVVKTNCWQTIHGRIHTVSNFGGCGGGDDKWAGVFEVGAEALRAAYRKTSSGRVPDPRATDPGLEAGWPDGRAVMCTSDDLLTASMRFQKPNPLAEPDPGLYRGRGELSRFARWFRRGGLCRRRHYCVRGQYPLYFSSKTRSSIGRVIFTLLPATSTTASSPVVEWPVDRMKNLSAA